MLDIDLVPLNFILIRQIYNIFKMDDWCDFIQADN